MTMIKNKIIILDNVDRFVVELDKDKLIRIGFMDYDEYISDKLIDTTLHDIDTSSITETSLTKKISDVINNCQVNGIIDNKNLLYKIYNYLQNKFSSLNPTMITNSIIQIQVILNAITRSLKE